MKRPLLAIIIAVAAGSLLAPGSGPASARDGQPKAMRVSTTKVPPVPVLEQTSAAALSGFSMSWHVLPGGGMSGGTSSNYHFGGAVGQAFASRGENSGNELGAGFWYGVETCQCSKVGDINGDGFYDTLDLNDLIDILFFGKENVQDPTCPSPRADMNCDGLADPVDLNHLIDLLFFGGGVPCNPCTQLPI